jgi:hypothetical protein
VGEGEELLHKQMSLRMIGWTKGKEIDLSGKIHWAQIFNDVASLILGVL